ncbi:MAG: hypothetical protein IJ693_04975 [Bacteroidaceae bacterium]|nr:hypothetical protein [Bacteroidaceae bacterium]
MKEFLELRIDYKYAHLLFKEDEGVNLGDDIFGPSVKVVKIDTGSPIFEKVGQVNKSVREKYNNLFFAGWKYIRKYTTKELTDARLFQMDVRKYFEPTGEECGTEYDEHCACEICGSGRKQVSPLRLKKGRFLNKRDVATTIGNEIVVSKRFVEVMKENCVKGMTFGPVYWGKNLAEDCYQLMTKGEVLEISEQTKFGINPYDFSEKEGTEVFKCPQGDNLGLNILSEVYVKENASLFTTDFFISKQTCGMKSGYLNPTHLLFCSPRLYHVIKDNGLKGFDFEVAHVVENID